MNERKELPFKETVIDRQSRYSVTTFPAQSGPIYPKPLTKDKPTNGALPVILDPRHNALLMKHMVTWCEHDFISSLEILQANSTPFAFFMTFVHIIVKIAVEVSIVEAHFPWWKLHRLVIIRCRVIYFFLEFFQDLLLLFFG